MDSRRDSLVMADLRAGRGNARLVLCRPKRQMARPALPIDPALNFGLRGTRGMSDVDELRALMDKVPKPVCAALTPFHIAAADSAAGVVRLEFAEQPAFRN